MRSGLVLTAIAPFILLTVCSNMATTAIGPLSSGQAVVLSGQIHGGRQPVVNSTVTLWAAGNAGYGSAATQIGASTSTDSNGNFAFTGLTSASCPSTTSTTASQYLYMVASGGQPSTGVTNSSAAFMVALGNCTTVIASSASVNINEVTTVASMFALQQFFAPNTTSGLGSFGTSATNLTGLANAMATVNNLVNINTGTSYASTTASGTVAGYTTAPTVTITPEQSKINTLANILANCINSDGLSDGTCPTLFADVNATAAKDTLQAAYYLATNPTSTVSGTSNLSTIYTLPSAESPFSPALGAQPTDWTIAVTYGSNSSQTVGGVTDYFMYQPEYIALDSTGNLWMVNYKNGTTPGVVGNTVSEISPTGTPLAQVLTAAGQIIGPRSLVIDPSNNLWIASYGTSTALGTQVVEYVPGTTATVKTFTTAAGPVNVTSDGAGNIFVATTSGTGGGADLELIPAGSASGASTTVLATGVTAGIYGTLAIDSHETLWLPNYASTSITQYLCSSTGTPSLPTSCTGTVSTAGGQYGTQSAAVDHSNNIWVGNYPNSGGSSLSEIAATTTTTINGVSGSPFYGGGLANPSVSIVDGLGNVWVSNYKSAAGTISEFNSSGVALTPAATTTPAFTGGFARAYKGTEGLAIDNSGNVWTGSNAASSATAQAIVTEIIGAAGPVTIPLAAALPTVPGPTSKLGVRP
jgi:hypothetical protein